MEEMELFETLLYSHTGEGKVFSTNPVEIPGIEGERPLTLYLPPDYLLDPQQSYAIAYLFDGQNLYDRSEWPMGWNLHYILDQRAAAGLEVPIVVGIHHGVNRDEELCPWPAEKGQTPRGDELLDWIVGQLHPELCEQLRIDDRPEMRMIGGSSLGGLLALYAGFRHSDFFGKVMSMSPSLWVGDGAVYDYIAEAAFLHNLDFLRLYIDCGALEADEEEEAWSEDFFEDADDETEDKPEAELAEGEVSGSAAEEAPADDGQDIDEDIDADEDTDADQDTEEDQDIDTDVEDSAEADDEDVADNATDDETDAEPEDEWETDPLEDAEYLVDILVAKGFEQGVHFEWISDPEGEHNEWHWSKRLPLAFAYLFDDDAAEASFDAFEQDDSFDPEEALEV